jgi:hypothetical protein
VYYFATVGSALLAIGVWQTGIGSEKIVADGAGFVVTIGLIVSALGYFAASVPPAPSTISAAIGYFFGLIGGCLLMMGLVKLQA